MSFDVATHQSTIRGFRAIQAVQIGLAQQGVRCVSPGRMVEEQDRQRCDCILIGDYGRCLSGGSRQQVFRHCGRSCLSVDQSIIVDESSIAIRDC